MQKEAFGRIKAYISAQRILGDTLLKNSDFLGKLRGNNPKNNARLKEMCWVKRVNVFSLNCRHGFGDCRKPLPESAALIEEIVHQQMNTLVSSIAFFPHISILIYMIFRIDYLEAK